MGREHAKFLHCGDEGYKKGIMWRELNERGQGKKGTSKNSSIMCVCETETQRETEREIHSKDTAAWI